MRRIPHLVPLASFVSLGSVGLASLALSSGAAGCSSSAADKQAANVTTIQSSQTRNLTPLVAPQDAATLAGDEATFALAFTKIVAASSPARQNVFLSPFSISEALAMTYAGARGQTATEMAATLHFTLPEDQLHPAFDAVDLAVTSRAAQDGSKLLAVANGVWGSDSLTFQQPFIDTLGEYYGAPIRLVDFGADGAVTAINQWVSDTTAGNIPTLLSPDAVGASTKMVLVDAIYFRAKWMTTFDASATTPEAFTKLDGSTVQAPAMSKWILGVRYAEGAGYQALDLPYESGDTSMLVVLPAEGSFPTFEQSFGASEYAALVGSLLPDYVDVTLPKFTIEPPAASIKPELQALGMSAAFTGAADFSGMSGTPLSIGDVIHEAIVKVDESGTVAAAATAVTMDSSVVLQPPTKTFDARRPFLFFIRDVATGTILFSGELVDPS